MSGRVVVERLRIRVAGVERGAASAYGEAVARALAARLAAAPPARPPAAIRLRLPADASPPDPGAMAERIAGSLR